MAETEYCPARISQTHLFDAAPEAQTRLFAYRLAAASPRTVSGSIAVKTSAGWLAVSFANVKLEERDEQWISPTTAFKRRAFVSAPLYARMPQNVTVLSDFVETAETSGDSLFGWDAKGRVGCTPPAGFEFHGDPTKRGLSLQNPIDEPGLPDAKTPIATASITSAPGKEDCPVPFARATVTVPMVPQYPRELQSAGASGTTYVAVAIAANGTPDDFWVWAPSGFAAIDRETLRVARASRYRGGTSFCAPAPGIFLFRADFRPN